MYCSKFFIFFKLGTRLSYYSLNILFPLCIDIESSRDQFFPTDSAFSIHFVFLILQFYIFHTSSFEEMQPPLGPRYLTFGTECVLAV